MAIKFAETFEALHMLLLKSGIAGDWRPEPNGVSMLQCSDGGNLHWASGFKSIWIDGTTEPADQLRRQLASALQTADKPAKS